MRLEIDKGKIFAFCIYLIAQDDLQSRTGGDEKKRRTQEEMESRGRKGSSCARSEEMERAGDR